jgi:hypothetical protein
MDAQALQRFGDAVRADVNAGRHFGASLLVARGGQVVYRDDIGTVAPGRSAAETDRYVLMSMSVLEGLLGAGDNDISVPRLDHHDRSVDLNEIRPVGRDRSGPPQQDPATKNACSHPGDRRHGD